MKRVLPDRCRCGARVAAPAAFGVLPKKNGVYVGDIKSSPFSMHVSLAVGSTGKTARFTYLCGTGRAPTTISGLVVDGKGYFKFASNPATATTGSSQATSSRPPAGSRSTRSTAAARRGPSPRS